MKRRFPNVTAALGLLSLITMQHVLAASLTLGWIQRWVTFNTALEQSVGELVTGLPLLPPPPTSPSLTGSRCMVSLAVSPKHAG